LNWNLHGPKASGTWPSGVKFIAPGGIGNVVVVNRNTNAAGGNDYAVSNGSWTAVDSTNVSITIPAVAGDMLSVGVSAMWSGSAYGFLTAATVVSGSPVNYIDTRNNTPGTNGIDGWYDSDNAATPGSGQAISGEYLYTVSAGDISGGKVTIRLYAKASGSGKTILARSGFPLQFVVKNLGSGSVGSTSVATLASNDFTGAQLIRAAATQDAIEILGRAGGTSSFKATITPLALSDSRSWSLPDRSDTFAGLKSNTFTESQSIGTGVARTYLTIDGSSSSTDGGSVIYIQNSGTGVLALGNWSSIYGGEYNSAPTLWAPSERIIVQYGFILGTDPGGSDLLRVGGSINIASGQGYKVAGTKVVGGQASAIADVSTADATDLTSAIALANANKAKINAILAMLRTHGLIAT
jgi:hypothetical protein